MPPVSKTLSRVQRNAMANFGRQLEPIAGITLSTGQMLANLDCDRRYHRLLFQTTAVNYTGGTGLAVTNLTAPAAAAGTADLAVSNGVPGAVSGIAGAATGWTTGDKGVIADATGAGATFTATAAAGALTALVYDPASATPTAVNPLLVIGAIQISVNGSPIIDTSAALEINRALFNNALISYGQLPIFFTEPWRNINRWPAITSWDLAGQKTFSVKFFFLPGFVNIGVAGVYEYDFIRNTIAGEIDGPTYQAAIAAGNAPAPLLQIIARHTFTPQLNGGDSIINNIPFNWPILRMHMVAGTPATLTKVIINQDGQIAEQGQVGASAGGAVLDQLRESLIEYGFNTAIFDYSYVADKSQRIQDALKVGASLKLTVTSTIAEGLTILQERLQSRFE